MNHRNDTATDDDQRGSGIGRRKFLAVGGAIATTLVAGCTGGDTGESTGTFQLYISDQPIAIDEFDSLDVTIDGARLYRGEEEPDDADETTTEETTEATTDETETTEEPTAEVTNQTETETETGEKGFIEIDVDDETVDLTTVTGEKAMGVFEGELPAGRYSSLHISVSEVEGVVDGEDVDVKLPSDRLKIVKPFELAEGDSVEFVFDITVVKKGQSGGYNLLPVVGESGVVGEDVEMEEVDPDEANGGASSETTAE